MKKSQPAFQIGSAKVSVDCDLIRNLELVSAISLVIK